jgi:autotransporter-associated beta strand protein
VKTQAIKISLTCLAVLTSAAFLRAAVITKTNDTDNLNLPSSWTNGVVPGIYDQARWDANVTGTNSAALGTNMTWGGIVIANPGGAVTISSDGNTLTLSTNGINMGGAMQNLTIGSGLTLGGGAQTWNVTNTQNLTVSGTFTRPVGNTLIVGSSTVAAASQGTVTCSPTLENGILPWAAALSSGTASNASANGYTFATVSGGNIVAYTNATPETTAGTGVSFGGIPAGDNSTVNYDLNVGSTGGALTSDTYVNSLRYIGTAGYTNPGTANFRANAIMNSGSGWLTIATPLQQADTNLNELVVAQENNGIMFKGPISDNANPLHITILGTGSGTNNILFTNLNTFSGGVTINSGKVGVGISSLPQSGTVTNGPLGTGPITLNGGILYSMLGGYAIGNPIVVGPAGGQMQYASASPDLTINGNVTGSGTLIMNGVYNVNGLFLDGDDSGFTGTVIVTGSNNRLGTSQAGSASAKWVVNGGFAANVTDGTNYYLGELSGSTGGGLCGHAGNLAPAIQNFVVGQLNTSSTFAGIIVNNAAGNAQTGNSDAAALNVVALTKVGTGTLTLSGANTATGPLTISNGAVQLGAGSTTGTLATNAPIVDNASLIINHSNTFAQGTNFYGGPISGSGSLTQFGTGMTILTAANTYTGSTTVSNGILMVNGSIAGTATVMPGAKLSGNGTIGDVVTVQAGGQLGAGDTATTIGSLTLNATPVLNGSVLVKVNAGTAQSDLITVTGVNSIHYAGSLVVSNVSGPLLAGDSFTIFNAFMHSGNFATIVGSPGPGLAYAFTNGVLSVVSTIASNPTNVTATASSFGDYDNNIITNTVTVGWPADHTGWMLQSQTNDVSGALNPGGPWYDMLGSTNIDLLNFTNPTDLAVYFRLRYLMPPLPATAPNILSARGTNHAVALSWTAPAYARTYNIKSATNSGGPYTTVANVIPTSYTVTGLINSNTYYFVVSALNYNGETANSGETNAIPIARPPTPPVITNVMAAHGIVTLIWSNTAGLNSTNYNIKRAIVTGGPYTTIATTPQTAYSDTVGLSDGTTYYYVVSAVGNDGEGLNSAETNATPTATTPAVPAPVVATGQYEQVRVSWTPSFGATGYNVKVSATSGGPYTTFTNSPTATAYVTGLADNTTYYIVVSSLNAIGESANSTEASATTLASLPLSYDFENTGLAYPTPTLPALGSTNATYILPLPDPFYWAADPLNMGGTGSTNFSDWEHHRAEIIAQLENYEIGYKPYVDFSNETVTISGTGTSRTLSVVVTNWVSGTPRTIALSFAITLPASGTNTWPVIIGMNSASGSVNSSLLTQVAKVNFQINQVTVYGAQADTDPYYQFYAPPYSAPAPFPSTINSYYTGQYSAWAWGFSRIIDGLYKLNGNLGGGAKLDLTRIADTGCSYAGKMALFCGALDERVKLIISQESGGGGCNSWRYNGMVETPGSVEWLPNTDHNWFEEPMFSYGILNSTTTNAAYLPEDHHELAALCAPRALFATGNDGQVWLGTPSTYVCCRAVEQIYESFGLTNRFGFNLIGNHAHCSTTSQIDAEMGAYINTFLLNSNNINTIIRDYPTATNTVQSVGVMVDDYNKIPAANWTAWWGTTNPVITTMGPSCGNGQAQTPCP